MVCVIHSLCPLTYVLLLTAGMTHSSMCMCVGPLWQRRLGGRRKEGQGQKEEKEKKHSGGDCYSLPGYLIFLTDMAGQCVPVVCFGIP